MFTLVHHKNQCRENDKEVTDILKECKRSCIADFSTIAQNDITNNATSLIKFHSINIKNQCRSKNDAFYRFITS